MAPLLAITILCSSLSISLILNSVYTMVRFLGAKNYYLGHLLGQWRGISVFRKSITFFRNLVVSLGNLRAVLDKLLAWSISQKLLWFHSQGSACCFWNYHYWGKPWCPFTFLAGLQNPSGSSPEQQGWCPEVTLWWQEVRPEASWGPFPLELLCDPMISLLAYVRSIAQLSS